MPDLRYDAEQDTTTKRFTLHHIILPEECIFGDVADNSRRKSNDNQKTTYWRCTATTVECQGIHIIWRLLKTIFCSKCVVELMILCRLLFFFSKRLKVIYRKDFHCFFRFCSESLRCLFLSPSRHETLRSDLVMQRVRGLLHSNLHVYFLKLFILFFNSEFISSIFLSSFTSVFSHVLSVKFFLGTH